MSLLLLLLDDPLLLLLLSLTLRPAAFAVNDNREIVSSALPFFGANPM